MKHGGDTEVVGTGHGKYMDSVVGGRGPWKGLKQESRVTVVGGGEGGTSSKVHAIVP